MLKGAFTVGLLGLTIGLISFGISYTRSPREPTVDVPAVIDLGVQAKGRHVETGFLIRNRGMEALVLRNFGTTCGCVRPFRRRAAGQTEVVEEVVPPLSEIEIHVGAAIRGDKGDFEHWVRFDTNDPGRPHVEIALIGKVDIGVYTTPSQLHLGRLHPGQEVQQTVRVVDCRTRGPRTPLQIKSSSPVVHIEGPTSSNHEEDRNGVGAGDDVYLVRLSIIVPNADCNINDNLRVQDDAGNILVTIPVAGSVERVVSLSPSSLLLAKDTLPEHAQFFERRCLCWCRQSPLSLSVAKSQPGLDISVTKSANPNVRFIEVKCPASKLPFVGTKSVFLSVTCGNGYSETLELPLTIVSAAQK